jgi:hypothetical protein
MVAGAVPLVDSRVTGRIAGRLAARAQVSKGVWAAQVASWLGLVDLCLELDDVSIYDEAPDPKTVQLHKAVLNLGIGTGEWLIHQIRANQVDLSASGEKLETLEASLELLRICYNSQHVDVSEDEIREVQKRIFNAAA